MSLNSPFYYSGQLHRISASLRIIMDVVNPEGTRGLGLTFMFDDQADLQDRPVSAEERDGLFFRICVEDVGYHDWKTYSSWYGEVGLEDPHGIPHRHERYHTYARPSMVFGMHLHEIAQRRKRAAFGVLDG